MTTNAQSVLVIAPLGQWPDSLLVLLQAGDLIVLAGLVDSGPTSLQWFAERAATAVLVDADLPGEQAWTVLQQLAEEWPQLPCLALAHTHAQAEQARGREPAL